MNTNTAIIVEALNLKSNRRRLYLSSSQFDTGMVVSVDFRCTDGSQTALALVTGAASADDPRLEGKLPTHRVRAYYTGPIPVSYDAMEPAEDWPNDVDLTEFEDEEEEDGE